MLLNKFNFKLEHPFVVFLVASVVFHLLLLILPYSSYKEVEENITVELVFEEPEIIIPVEKSVKASANSVLKTPAPPQKTQPLKTKFPGVNPKLNLKDVLGNPSSKNTKLSTGEIKTVSPKSSNENAVAPDIKSKSSATSLNKINQSVPANETSLGTKKSNLQNLNSVDNAKILEKTAAESNAGSLTGGGVDGKLNNVSLISGINGRKIVFKPSPPEIDIQNTNAVQFLILILPSGDVSRVTPYKKGNPRLEKEGINYIRKFKFEPVFSETIQQGIIELSVIRGKIQGK